MTRFHCTKGIFYTSSEVSSVCFNFKSLFFQVVADMEAYLKELGVILDTVHAMYTDMNLDFEDKV